VEDFINFISLILWLFSTLNLLYRVFEFLVIPWE